MKAVIQRVQWAEVWVDERLVSRIERGILTLLGIEKGDTEADLDRMVDQIVGLRIFEDLQGKMNLDLKAVSGAHLLVSQFTLAADLSGGRRPAFTRAETPARAQELYERGLKESARLGVPTQGGVFRADMKIRLENDGPVTFVLHVGNAL